METAIAHFPALQRQAIGNLQAPVPPLPAKGYEMNDTHTEA
ncbi:hypothetical protein GGI1_21259, partial [Acidithiobacillus sp. GGI-221]